ncbi:hypothetical protein A584_01796 [Pseudomonas syringae pv. theae ICMP 3923]|uniref:Uncharacterized protein n=1 Tax=Pseudomonas syringae pv. theae TaxID=103985 RepID=A0A0Q0L1I4_PSESX|nr:hypothetical protein [Pseudomonas syringae]EPM73243.1 hypothetical protein A584_01796 [Pseudomonas syringae pv. theae ICMP 3923]KPZ34768.1 hypothetical protein AN901_203203 [Pseudomonas syringae pv. theae]MBL3872224.1 hypothetical protein [Pseudomonas syringae pv. theae]RMT65959.1 hypothetical protein ALP44_01723 [Pseudomonas syringae pv. theae]GKQ32689.1 hypothetical protein PSTH68_24240 [Pseudomonas syringae pv. theae]
MSIPSLSEMIVTVEIDFPAELSGLKLTGEQVTRLERIKQASEEAADCFTSGIEAIGEMMGLAENGEMSAECVMGIGWLLKELGGLTRKLNDQERVADYKLNNMARAQSANRGAHGDDQ